MSEWSVRRLQWEDVPLADVETPNGTIKLTLGLGSGLARRAGDAPGRLWAIADRGANLKIKVAVERYGLHYLAPLARQAGAKVIPRPELGPTIAELRVVGDRVELVHAMPLRLVDGTPLTGLPIPGAPEALVEPAFGLDGGLLAPDPAGADTEAIVAFADGSFCVAEEYGPSLLWVDANGTVTARWLPQGSLFETTPSAQRVLPQAAARRRLNRGFEGLALSADGRALYVACQSGLEGGRGDRVRIWTLAATTGEILAEHDYPFDSPKSFRRDAALGDVGEANLKLCEIVCVGRDRLLVLERISHTAKIYSVDLSVPNGAVLAKRLLFSTDDAPQVAPDLEGVAALSDRSLILVTDNDFGAEGAVTQFFELNFDQPFVTTRSSSEPA